MTVSPRSTLWQLAAAVVAATLLLACESTAEDGSEEPSTPSGTSQPSPTSEATATAAASTATATPTSTASDAATATPTSTASDAATATPTLARAAPAATATATAAPSTATPAAPTSEATPTATATATPTTVSTPAVATPDPLHTGGADAFNCGGFSTWRAAQDVYEANLPGNPNKLDQDNDGVACEGLPGAP